MLVSLLSKSLYIRQVPPTEIFYKFKNKFRKFNSFALLKRICSPAHCDICEKSVLLLDVLYC